MWPLLTMLIWMGAWDGPARLQEALALEQQGESAAALQALDQLVARESGWEMPRLEAARLRLKLGGTLVEVERLLTEARTVAPANPRGHYLWALLRLEQGRAPEAIASLEQAVALREDYADARYRLAGLLSDAGEWARAEHHFRHLTRQRPDWLPPRLGLARALEQLGRAGEAERELLRLLAEQPGNAVAQRRLAELYERMGRPERAAQVLQGKGAGRRQLRPLLPSRR